MICFPETSTEFIASAAENKQNNRHQVAAAATLSVLAFLVILALVLIFIYRARKKRVTRSTKPNSLSEMEDIHEADGNNTYTYIDGSKLSNFVWSVVGRIEGEKSRNPNSQKFVSNLNNETRRPNRKQGARSSGKTAAGEPTYLVLEEPPQPTCLPAELASIHNTGSVTSTGFSRAPQGFETTMVDNDVYQSKSKDIDTTAHSESIEASTMVDNDVYQRGSEDVNIMNQNGAAQKNTDEEFQSTMVDNDVYQRDAEVIMKTHQVESEAIMVDNDMYSFN